MITLLQDICLFIDIRQLNDFTLTFKNYEILNVQK